MVISKNQFKFNLQTLVDISDESEEQKLYEIHAIDPLVYMDNSFG